MMTNANPFFLPVWEFRLSFVYIGKNAGKCPVIGKGSTKVHSGGAYFNVHYMVKQTKFHVSKSYIQLLTPSRCYLDLIR